MPHLHQTGASGDAQDAKPYRNARRHRMKAGLADGDDDGAISDLKHASKNDEESHGGPQWRKTGRLMSFAPPSAG